MWLQELLFNSNYSIQFHSIQFHSFEHSYVSKFSYVSQTLIIYLQVHVSAFTLVGLNWLPPEQVQYIAVYVAHWRRYFGIWLREGSQVLPGKTPCLLQIFHRRIDRVTWGRRLPEQTPPGFSPEPL